HEQRELLERVTVAFQLVQDRRRARDAVPVAEIERQELAVGEEGPAGVAAGVRRDEARRNRLEEVAGVLLALELQQAEPLLIEGLRTDGLRGGGLRRLAVTVERFIGAVLDEEGVADVQRARRGRQILAAGQEPADAHPRRPDDAEDAFLV